MSAVKGNKRKTRSASKSSASKSSENNKRPLVSELVKLDEIELVEPDICLICHEDFNELEPPYPIGNKCTAVPKHTYHSRCLKNFYNSLQVRDRPLRNACMGCGTTRKSTDRNYANNEITKELITDVKNRANIEALAQGHSSQAIAQLQAPLAIAQPQAQTPAQTPAQAQAQAEARARHREELDFFNDLSESVNRQGVAEQAEEARLAALAVQEEEARMRAAQSRSWSNWFLGRSLKRRKPKTNKSRTKKSKTKKTTRLQRRTRRH